VQEVLALYQRNGRSKAGPERPEKQSTIETCYPTPKIKDSHDCFYGSFKAFKSNGNSRRDADGNIERA
jgi:hypothetical protein